MRYINPTFVALGILFLPLYVGAQQQERAPAAREAAPQKLTSDVMVPIDQLRKARVVDKQGQELGQVREIRVDPQEGKITQIEVGVGGILGIGEERFNVDFEHAEVMQRDGRIVLALSDEAARMARQDVERQRGAPAAGTR